MDNLRIYYCHKCGRRCSDEEVEAALAVDPNSDDVCCAACALTGKAGSTSTHPSISPSGSSSRRRMRQSTGVYAVVNKTVAPCNTRSSARQRVPQSNNRQVAVGAGVCLLVLSGSYVLLQYRTQATAGGDAKLTPAAHMPLNAPSSDAQAPAQPGTLNAASSAQVDKSGAEGLAPLQSMLSQPMSSESSLAAFDELKKFEGLASNDAQVRIRRADAFLKRYGNEMVSVRARRVKDELTKWSQSVYSVLCSSRSCIAVSLPTSVEKASVENLGNLRLEPNAKILRAKYENEILTLEVSAIEERTAYTLFIRNARSVRESFQLPDAEIQFKYQPLLLHADFSTGTLTGWTIVDEVKGDKSDWLVANGKLSQRSNLGRTSKPRRLGTLAVWNDPAALNWKDYVVEMTILPRDDDGIGLVFCYRDPENYYKLELDAQNKFAKLSKIINGIETSLANVSGGYATNEECRLKVSVRESLIQAWLNGKPIFSQAITDNSLEAGTVGVYCWCAAGVTFDDIVVVGAPR